MALESGTKISNLVQDNPPGTDQVAQGDDHIRLIKGVLKASFPSDVAVQIPDITDKAGAHLAVTEDGLSTEWAAHTPTSPNLFRYGKTSEQTFPLNEWEKIIFDVSLGDPAGWWVDNSWTIAEDGVYNIAACARVKNASHWDHDFAIKVNGDAIKQISYANVSETSNLSSISIDTAFNAVSGDVITVEAFTESDLVLGADSAGRVASLTGYRIA